MQLKEDASESPFFCVLGSYLQFIESDLNTAVIKQPLWSNWKEENNYKKTEKSFHSCLLM